VEWDAGQIVGASFIRQKSSARNRACPLLFSNSFSSINNGDNEWFSTEGRIRGKEVSSDG
jgi:hypothetical protein